MVFSVHDFIMRTIHGMVGVYPDFQVMEYSLNWYSKGKLTEADLEQIEEWLSPEPSPEPEPDEEPEE